MPSEAPQVLRFGPFEVDLAAGILRKEKRRVNIQEQPLRALTILLQRPGQLVTRVELQQALWPLGTFVELDQGLNTAIKKLRLALEDSVENPQLIETVPRRGYCFIAPVENVSTAPRDGFPRYSLLSTFAVILVVTLTSVFWLLDTRTDDTELVSEPLTSYPGAEAMPSFSPDGSQVTFQWRPSVEDRSDIYIKVIGASGELRLTAGSRDSYCPTWSPNGRSIAFLRKVSDTVSSLFLISPLGGPERKLSDVQQPDYPTCPAWHPSNKWLILSHRNVTDGTFSLFSISVDNEGERRLTYPKASGVDIDPAVSPRGDTVVFARMVGAVMPDLYLLPVDAAFTAKGQPKQLTFDHRGNFQPAWTADGRALVFCSGPPHSPSLYKLHFSWLGWRRQKRSVFAGEGVRNPTISKNGSLAYSRSTILANIWRLEVNDHHLSVKPPEKLIASTHLDHTPAYSPDGTRIAFTSDRSGSLEIWIANRDGSSPVQLTSFGDAYYRSGPRWSPEGSIFFYSNSGGTQHVYSVNPEGGEPQRVALEGLGDWSRDGNNMYFASQGEIWQTRWPLSPDAKKRKLTRQGGVFPYASSDGRFVYYLKNNLEMTSVWKVPVDGGPETQVIDSVCCQNLAVVNEGIYFIPGWHGEPHSWIKFLDFRSGRTGTVLELAGLPAYGFSISPDHKTLLYSQYEPPNSDLWMVEHFE